MARSQAPARAPTAGAEVVPARAVASGLGDASATGIALHVRALIVSGRLAPGARLPTVRSLAGTLHVGPTTVAEAWAHLRDEGLLRSHGRHGVFVDGSASWRSGRPDPGDRLDLSRLWPDPALLPVPGPFLTGAAEELAGGPDGSRVDDVLREGRRRLARAPIPAGLGRGEPVAHVLLVVGGLGATHLVLLRPPEPRRRDLRPP